MARIAVLSCLLLAAGCQDAVEPPPDPGPCGTWSVGPDWVLSARPDARFTQTGGVFTIRSFAARRHHGGVDADIFVGEVENTSGDVVCNVTGTMLIDGERGGSLWVLAPAYDVGTADSVACLGPGERGVFQGSTAPEGIWQPEYSRVEYQFEGERPARAVPHSLTPTLIEVRPTDDDGPFGGTVLEMGTRAPLRDVSVTVVARDTCGRVFGVWLQSSTERAGPPTFEVTIEGDGFIEPSERGLEVLTFTEFTAP